jgi:NRPS condensation-like uncharacterized protein
MFNLIPTEFRATITDRFLSAFYEKKGDSMMQVELEFDIRLNAQVLRQAFSRALDTEPILGCKFSSEKETTFWERIDVRHRDNFTVFTADNLYEEYRNTTLSAFKGPVLQGALLQREKGDKLLFKVAHEAADAAGAMDTVALVALTYRQLLKTPDFTPAPNIRSYRSARQLSKWIPKHALPFIWFNALKEMTMLILKRKACNPLDFSCDVSNRAYIERVLDVPAVTAIKFIAKKYNATINDIFLTAFLRSLYRNNSIANANIRCGMTVDLRRWYLPGGHAETITNLSGIEIVDIGKNPGVSFIDTLEKVVNRTSKRKRRWIGLNLHCGIFNLFRTWSYDGMKSFFDRQRIRDMHDKAVFPIFTNLGEIDKDFIVFEKPPLAAHIIVPAGFPPYFGMGVSGYGGTLTITAAVYPRTKPIVEKMLNEMTIEISDLK